MSGRGGTSSMNSINTALSLDENMGVIQLMAGWWRPFFIEPLPKGSSLPEVRSKARPSAETQRSPRVSLQLEMRPHLFKSLEIRPRRDDQLLVSVCRH